MENIIITIGKNKDHTRLQDVDDETTTLKFGNIVAVEVPSQRPAVRCFRILGNKIDQVESQLAFLHYDVRRKIFEFLLQNKYITQKRFALYIGVPLSQMKTIMNVLLKWRIVSQYGTYYKRNDEEWFDAIHRKVSPLRS